MYQGMLDLDSLVGCERSKHYNKCLFIDMFIKIHPMSRYIHKILVVFFSDENLIENSFINSPIVSYFIKIIQFLYNRHFLDVQANGTIRDSLT